MSTIKQQVLKEFPDAKCLNSTNDTYSIVSYQPYRLGDYMANEHNAWIAFKNKFCKPLPQLPINYKELVRKEFPTAQIWKDAMDFMYIESSITSEHKNTATEAWQSFYEQYCTDKPDLIIGNEYEFSNDNEEWYVREFGGFMGIDFGGHEANYNQIRPIQNKPKLDQLKQLAEELGYNLTKQ